jgi:hydroxymethylbilane synthase
MSTHLKLGTRRSLLAVAQSRAVAKQLEQNNTGLTIALVGIETRGDRTLDVPLSKMEGKEFFVAELDKALLDGDVDITVHSMKDLSLERPKDIALGAIPSRENPRDVVLFAPDIIARLSSGAPVRLGTSSPRRIENVPHFLAKALPRLGAAPQFLTDEIRGNVNTRISYLSLPEGNPKKIDAVVLAFAGLIRLWNSADGRRELEVLLAGVRWMILPLKECPAAPAQGALAVECRTNDQSTLKYLAGIHCPSTAAAVKQERQVLADWGGGCHQRCGATAEHHDDLGTLLFIRGRKPDGSSIGEVQWQPEADAPEHVIHNTPAPHWDGSAWRDLVFTNHYFPDAVMPPSLADNLNSDKGALFIAHSRALPKDWSNSLANSNQRVWTSGTQSWYRLAAQGVWVEGCAEEFGFDALRPLLKQKLLQLPDIADWTILTHLQGKDTWPSKNVIATYEARPAYSIDEQHAAVKALKQAKSVFWTSGSQYDAFKAWVPDNCVHACRYGKTYNYLRDRLDTAKIKGLNVFPSAAHWRARTKNQ